MSKQIVIYKPNQLGNIEKVTFVDGEVIDNEPQADQNSASGAWDFWNFFRSCGANRKPYNDNGREYNSATGQWEYTAAANGNANPFKSNYEAPQDNNGSVPVWDGYNGE